MTRLVKFLLILLGLAGLGILILGASLNAIVKAGLETMGPQILGTPVTVEDVDISLLGEGGFLQGTLSGLVIHNPPGFHTPHALRLPETRILVQRDSILTDTVIIQEIVVDRPDVTLEESLEGKSNLAALKQRVEEYAQRRKSSPPTSSASEQSGETKTRVHIQRVLVRQGQIHLSVKGLQGRSLNVPLPDIQLRDIGKTEEGVSFQQAGVRLFDALYAEVIKGVPSGGKLLGGSVGESVKDFGKAAEKAGKTLLKGLLD